MRDLYCWWIFLGLLNCCVHPENGVGEFDGHPNPALPADQLVQKNVSSEFPTGGNPRGTACRYGRDVQHHGATSIGEQFKEYYRCIEKKNREYEAMKSGGEVILIEEGQRVEMTCELCLRPDQEMPDYVIRWKRAFSGHEKFIQVDEKKFQVLADQTLVVHDVQIEDAGQYYCVKNGAMEKMYVIDVVLFEQRRRVVEHGMSGESAAPDQSLASRNLRLTTVWSSWSECDKCGRGGFRRRMGTCIVTKISKNRPVKPLPAQALDKFINVPCRSSLLPEFVRNVPEVEKRESESMIGRCFIPCPTFASKIVTDRTGQVIDALRVEEKYYDVGKAKPTLLPLVVRKSLYETRGKNIVLSCPHTSKANIHIRWQNGTTLINPISIKKATDGRVRIDVYGRLHVKNLDYPDSRTYSCWVKSRLVATTKLVIVHDKDTNMKDYIVYAGCGMVVLTMLVICLGIITNRNKKTLR